MLSLLKARAKLDQKRASHCYFHKQIINHRGGVLKHDQQYRAMHINVNAERYFFLNSWIEKMI